MQIYGPFRVSTAQSTNNVQSSESVQSTGGVDRANSPTSASEAQGNSAPVDQLDLSHAATSANRVEGNAAVAGEGIRFDRVAEIRRQIADGSYDTPEKMDAALDRFLDLLG